MFMCELHSRNAFRRANAGDMGGFLLDGEEAGAAEKANKNCYVIITRESDLTCPDKLEQRGSKERSWHLDGTL